MAGGAETPPPRRQVFPGSSPSLSGVVADGYLVGATVCSDQNGNKQCDAGEPTTITTAGGLYTMEGDNLDQYPIIVEVDANVVDEDTGTAVGKDYTLSAPKPANLTSRQVVNPITTLVQNQIETNPVLDRDQAAAQVKTDLGVADNVDLFDDFVAQGAQGDADYKLLHATSRVIANVMADTQEQMKAAAEGSGLSFEEVKAEIVQLVVDNVMTQLETIVAPVMEARQTAMDNSVDFDPATFDVATAAADITAPEVETIAEQIQEKQTPVAASSFQTALEDDGYHWLWGETHQDANGGTVVKMEYGIITGSADSNTLSEAMHEYDWDTDSWAPMTMMNDTEHQLINGAWVTTSDAAGNETIAYGDNNTATLTNTQTGGTETVTMVVKDVSGLTMRAVLGKASFPLKDQTAVFPEGSKIYKAKFSPGQDIYKIETWTDENDPNLDNNAVRYWNGSSDQFVYSLADVQTIFAYQGDNYLGLDNDLAAQFAANGVLKIYQGYQGPLVGVGSYELVTVQGKELLMLNVPVNFKDYPAETTFLTVPAAGDPVKYGWFIPANSVEEDDEFGGNSIAFNAVLDNLNTSGVYPAGLSGKRSFVQYRSYENNAAAEGSRAYLSYDNLNSAPLDTLVESVTFDGSNVTPSFREELQLTYDCRNQACFETPPTTDHYAFFDMRGEELAAGAYEFDTTLTDGTLLTSTIKYPGKLVLPVIDSSTRDAQWDSRGNLVLSWKLPTGTNADLIDQIRVVIDAPTTGNSQALQIKLAANAETIVLPPNLTEPLGLSPAGNLYGARWTLQTRAHTNGKNYARGVSDTLVLP